MIAAAFRLARALSPTAWLTIALLIAFLMFGAFCAQRAAQGERDAQATQTAKTEARASTARETAADERSDDDHAIRDQQQERNHAAQALPDSVPDDRELRRRCRQLRDAGRIVSACVGLGGPA